MVVLRPRKRPDIFSYRSSKRGPERIDHTFRTELFKQTSPKELGKTIVRAEVYVPGGKGNDAARILNSSIPKAREIQRKERPLDLRIFDIVKFKGKNVEDKPYKEKIDMLKEVSKKMPDLKLPQLAFDPQEKRQMLYRIMGGEHPETEEGLVIYKLNDPKPIKVKKTDDYDAKIVGTFDANPGTKYEGKAIGGFLAKPEGSNKTIRIGTGLSDRLRKDAYKNPDKYIGEWARIKSQHVHSTGMHQAPVLVDIRAEKFEKSASEFLNNRKADWRQLKYLAKHKKDVYQAGRELGAPRLQLLLHDRTKFKPKN